jgi:archaeoflavoprotein AfpA
MGKEKNIVATEKVEVKKKKMAWGISGAGDKIQEFLQVMTDINKEYADKVEIQVFISKAAEIVLKYYGLETQVRQSFSKVTVEVNSNSPFLAAWMQMRKFEFLLIAPASSNTTAKIALGIGDTLLTNAANMSLKAFVPIYVVPTDFEEKTVYTKLPNGTDMKLRIRKEDAENVRKLERMEDVHVLSGPQKIREVFKEWFGQA